MAEYLIAKNISGCKMIFLIIGAILICVGIVGFIWCAVSLINDDEGEENEL